MNILGKMKRIKTMIDILYIFFILPFFPSTQIYITQGCSLHSFKSSRGVGVEIVEKILFCNYEKF
jgi:TRAP-type mannitol/chloroaromatic compound transport system permease small subunit